MAIVLIVDDRNINREYLRSLLEYLQHEVIEAQNGIEGLECVQKKLPDLIITDILMPQMDGYEFVRQLKLLDNFKNIPIIFYTATYRKEEAILLAEDLQVQYVLSKPSDPHTMIQTIQAALGFNPTQTLKPSFDDLKNNLYQAPQQFIGISGTLQHSLKQIEKIKDSIKHNLTLTGENKPFLTMLEGLSADLTLYRKVNSNLFSLIELTLEMIAEKDPHKLLQLFCHGTRKSVGATFAVAGIFDNQNTLKYFATSGRSPISIKKEQFNYHAPFLAEIFQQRSAFIFNGNPKSTQFIFGDTVTSALCSPIRTTKQCYGFTYFVNPKVSPHFKEEEISMLDTLCSELAIFYENIELCLLLQQQAAKLQIESSNLKMAKDNLFKSEMMFRQFAENIEDVFWRISPDIDKFIYVSPGYQNIWGKTPDSLYDQPCSWQESLLDEDKLKVKNYINNLLQDQENSSLEFRIKHPDGTVRNIYNKTIRLNHGKAKSDIIGIASDITAYLQNQKEIMLEQALNLLLEKNTPLLQTTIQILQLICKTFDWEIGELWLVDDEINILKNMGLWHKKRKSYQEFSQTSAQMSLHMNEDLPGMVWKNGKLQWFENYSQSHFERSALAQKLELHDAVGIPLSYQEKVLGVLMFLANRMFIFDENFIRILTMMSTRISEYMYQKMTQEQLLKMVRRGNRHVIF